MVPRTDRERTVTPRTTPSVFVVRYPSSEKAVVVIVGSIGCAIVVHLGDQLISINRVPQTRRARRADRPREIACDFAHSYGFEQVKFAASLVSPEPAYAAIDGYGQSGRVRSLTPLARCDAGICAGVFFCSTHCSSTARLSNTLVPSPPPQWAIPGTMNRRIESAAFSAPPCAFTTLW